MSKLVYRGIEYQSHAPHWEKGFIHYCMSQRSKQQASEKEKARDQAQHGGKELIV